MFYRLEHIQDFSLEDVIYDMNEINNDYRIMFTHCKKQQLEIVRINKIDLPKIKK